MNVTLGDAVRLVSESPRRSKERAAVIEKIVPGHVNLSSPTATEQMRQRAEFFTALRERKLWPLW